MQKVLWKVLAYRGSARAGALHRAARHAGHRHAASTATATRSPSRWSRPTTSAPPRASSRSRPGGCSASGGCETPSAAAPAIRVEEYKRPTFEVTLKDPTEPLRLNRPATFDRRGALLLRPAGRERRRALAGDARAALPRGGGAGGGGGRAARRGRQTIASGTVALGADGTFAVAFTPAADERAGGDEKDVTLPSSRSAADVTDEGGETRSASRAFRLGFVSVEATHRADGRASCAPERRLAVTVDAHRPRRRAARRRRAPGGSSRCVQPARRCCRPTSRCRPRRRGRTGAAAATPGDALRPRWEHGVRPRRCCAAGRTAARCGRGDAATTTRRRGRGRRFPTLAARRLPAASTRPRDDFGATCEASEELVVAGAAHAARAAGRRCSPRRARSRSARRRASSSTRASPTSRSFLEVYREERLRRAPAAARRAGTALIEIPVARGAPRRLRGAPDARCATTSSCSSTAVGLRAVGRPGAEGRVRDLPRHAAARRAGDAGASRSRTRPASRSRRGAAELLAYMYDRSLDVFAPHTPPRPAAPLPDRAPARGRRARASAQAAHGVERRASRRAAALPGARAATSLKFYDGYGIGGPGRRGRQR